MAGQMQYVATSADNDHLWGINKDGKPFHKGGQPDDVWTSVPCDYVLKQISVSGDGSIIWAIAHHEYLLRREGLYGSWEVIPNDAKNWQSVSISADGNHVAGLDEADNVWNREYPAPWVRRTGELLHVALTGDGQFGWGVDRDHYVYYRDGFEGKWVRVTGRLKFISVSADGNHVWGVNHKDIIFYRKGKHDYWKDMHMQDNMHGRAKQITVSGDGEHIYSVDRNDDIWHLPGYPGYMREDGWVAKNIKAGLKEVAVGAYGQVYGTDNDGQMWYNEDPHGPWVKVDSPVTSVSVVGTDILWGVDAGRNIYYRGGVNEEFKLTRGGMKFIAASADGNHIWGINRAKIVYYKPGYKGEWNPIGGGRGKSISVSGDGEHVWWTEPNDEVRYRNGPTGAEVVVDGNMKHITVSADGNHVWAVDTYSKVHYRQGYGGSWMEVEGATLDTVSVSGDGGVLYGVGTDGKTYHRTC